MTVAAEGDKAAESDNEGESKHSPAELNKSKAKIKACGTKLKDLAKVAADLLASQQVPLG